MSEAGNEAKERSLAEKAEDTITGLGRSSFAYLKTFGLIANPLRYGRLVRLLTSRRDQPASAADATFRPVPPLLFLGIGSFLLATVIKSFDSDVPFGLEGSRAWIKGVLDNISLDASILDIVIAALPLFAFTVITARLISWLFCAEKKREGFFELLCYAFGFLWLGWFLVFMYGSLLEFTQASHPGSWICGRRVDSYARWLLGIFLLYTLLRPVIVLVVGSWQLGRHNISLLRFGRVLLVTGLYFVVLMSGIWVGTLPSEFSAALRPEQKSPQFHFVRTVFGNVEYQIPGRNLLLKLLIQNTTSKTVLLRPELGNLIITFGEANSYSLVTSPLRDNSWQERGAAPVVTLKPGEARLVECIAEVGDYESELLRNQEPTAHFLAVVSWQKPEARQFPTQHICIGDNLDFWSKIRLPEYLNCR